MMLCPAGCPSERAMVLAHIRKQAFTAVLKETGLRGLYFGFSATLYRDITFNMIFFTSRELFVKLYKHRYPGMDPDAKTRVLLGFPAGTLASILACPFDVVKTRQQGMELGKFKRTSFHARYFPLYLQVERCIHALGPCWTL